MALRADNGFMLTSTRPLTPAERHARALREVPLSPQERAANVERALREPSPTPLAETPDGQAVLARRSGVTFGPATDLWVR